MLSRVLLMQVLFLLSVQWVHAEGIAGVWKHSSEPGWIEIDQVRGEATVVVNEKFPERVGRVLLKDLAPDPKRDNRWTGQVYAEQFGEYRDVEVSLTEKGILRFKVKVGFISRKIDWVRSALPAADAQ